MPTNDKLDQNSIKRYFKPTNKYTLWKSVGLLIIGLLVASIILVAYFIYSFSYTTLSNANAIVALSSSLSVDAVDSKALKIARDLIKLKIDLPLIKEPVRNIFYYVEIPTSTANTNKNTNKQ